MDVLEAELNVSYTWDFSGFKTLENHETGFEACGPGQHHKNRHTTYKKGRPFLAMEDGALLHTATNLHRPAIGHSLGMGEIEMDALSTFEHADTWAPWSQFNTLRIAVQYRCGSLANVLLRSAKTSIDIRSDNESPVESFQSVECYTLNDNLVDKTTTPILTINAQNGNSQPNPSSFDRNWSATWKMPCLIRSTVLIRTSI